MLVPSLALCEAPRLCSFEAKTGVHHFHGDNNELGTACGRYYRVCPRADESCVFGVFGVFWCFRDLQV